MTTVWNKPYFSAIASNVGPMVINVLFSNVTPPAASTVVPARNSIAEAPAVISAGNT